MKKTEIPSHVLIQLTLKYFMMENSSSKVIFLWKKKINKQQQKNPNPNHIIKLLIKINNFIKALACRTNFNV